LFDAEGGGGEVEELLAEDRKNPNALLRNMMKRLKNWMLQHYPLSRDLRVIKVFDMRYPLSTIHYPLYTIHCTNTVLILY
jgi:hemerythrin